MSQTSIKQVLEELLGVRTCERLFLSLYIHPDLICSSSNLSRAQLAQALNMILFDDLCRRVPEAKQYVKEQLASGRKIVFDHGALRTVSCTMPALPSGQLAFKRLLEPLGFKLAATYPLDTLSMCGFVYTHEDYPADIAQYFVSELYPERFSERFNQEVTKLCASSRDPLSRQSQDLLQLLREKSYLHHEQAIDLLREIPRCFDRQHQLPSIEQYSLFKQESAEMAWISTEGSAFNHATDRVENLDATVEEQLRLQRTLKDKIEVGQHASIRQTAYRASQVEREFSSPEGIVKLRVPGSFFEFIERGVLTDTNNGKPQIDLRFDSRNAQGIFTMTRDHSPSHKVNE